MATAALRGLLVVAALALGFFVLSKAFPSGGEAPVEPGGGVTSPSPTTSPSVVDSPTREVAQPLAPSEIKVQVLNGTEQAGLAADTAEILEQAEYDIVTVDDAESAYPQTTIFHVPKRKIDAQLMQQQFFPTAVLEVADVGSKVDITVIIGDDYIEAQESGGGGGGTPEESPT
ncbi:MAG: LytR C-terminal domain-containing protein [Actinomycetota bacterium]